MNKMSTKELQDGDCYVALTHDHLDASSIMNRVRSPKAGAIVLFAGIFIQPPILTRLTYLTPRRNNPRQLRRQTRERAPIHILRAPCSSIHAFNMQIRPSQTLSHIDRYDTPSRCRPYW